jgi:hypothetical protein
MLKHIALALLFAGQFIPLPSIEDYEFGNAATKSNVRGNPNLDFACALVFNFDPPVLDGIASVSGSEYDLICAETRWHAVHNCVRSATKEREWIFRPGEGPRHSRKS